MQLMGDLFPSQISEQCLRVASLMPIGFGLQRSGRLQLRRFERQLRRLKLPSGRLPGLVLQLCQDVQNGEKSTGALRILTSRRSMLRFTF